MNQKQTTPPTPGLTLGDIYYILFRHKRKIVTISVLGAVAAALVYFIYPVTYISVAKLLIKYVVETKAPAQMGTKDPSVGQVEEGENAINTELEILRSFDLAKTVALQGTNFVVGLTPADVER